MKFLGPGFALALVAAGLAAVPTLGAQAAPADDSSMVQRMRATADTTTSVTRERATGQVGFIRARGGGDLLPSDNRGPAAKADAYLDQYARAFGARRDQLVRQSVSKGAHGTVVDYVQVYKGVPVFGAMIRAHVDRDGNLTSVNGEAVPDLDLSVEPRFSAAQAAERAVRMVAADPPGDGASDTSGLTAKTNDLMVYRTGLVKGDVGTNELVHRIEVTNEKNIRDIVFIDAMTNKPVNRYSMITDAIDRVLFEADENRDLTMVWEEGDPLPGDLNADQESMVRSTGDAYWFFANAFGRDSFDGQGATMYTINNDPAIECPNANWNGVTTNYCDGVSSDDVVAHEWGHAYTEYTHGLIYQWQAGALNESYSDVWGETIDLINGRMDEGEGNLSLKRDVGVCSTHSPAVPVLTVNAPAEIAKDCLTGGASFGEQLDATGITGDVVVPTDAAEEGGTATDGCSAYDEDVTGKIVMVDRGLCTFVEKAEMATAEGAAALIIGNRDNSPIGMSGDDQSLVATVSIGLDDREAIRAALADGETVNVTMKDAAGARGDSFRWLIGEKSDAFGGAIRDMWNPNCYGDPGKVSDAEYKCSTDDNGGVHGNSGVPNHGYALLVDGGTFNGTSVRGIGLEKAAHIYFRAMNDYQTPVSNFADHADSLEASCADLTGKRLTELSVAEDDAQASFEKITADDCSQVAAMAKAVELRAEPVQCEFEPLLPDAAGAACGDDFVERSVWSEDFETGFDDWAQEAEIPDGSKTIPWETDSGAPDHDSTTAFAPDPASYGDCVPGSDDYSSAASLVSPPVTLPDDGEHPVLSFDHYVATELGWDGGLVRASINGGELTAVPTDAYLTNGPNDTMETAPDNTSPLAGQDGFTGTDGGELSGSWGTSRIDLAALGAQPGDEVRFSFVMGRDGCNGFIGWFVDDVELTVCDVAPVVEPVASTTTAKPRPKRIKRKGTSKVTVTVAAGDVTATGTVEIRSKGKIVATGTLSGATTTVKVKGKKLKKGKNRLTATYLGSDEVAPSSDTFTIKVKKKGARS